MEIIPFFKQPSARLPHTAIFLSGSGSNAEALLNALRNLPTPVVKVQALVTDAPLTSRARELGRLFQLPVLELDIRAFYRARGESRVSIATPAGQQIREEWTGRLRELVKPLQLDFGVFAGFVPLTNITGDFPCLNVHPGDLTYLKDGRRCLVGLHTVPVERAILEGLDYLRSSVIVVKPYSGKGGEMDSGPLLGVSGKVPVLLDGATLEQLRACAAVRPAQRPKGGFGDRLEQIAAANQDNLKRHGDWRVLPQAVINFAAGHYAQTPDHQLLFDDGTGFRPVKTVEFDEDSTCTIIP